MSSAIWHTPSVLTRLLWSSGDTPGQMTLLVYDDTRKKEAKMSQRKLAEARVFLKKKKKI